MSENSIFLFLESAVQSIISLFLGGVIGAVITILADRKTFKYRTKSTAKAELLSSIWEFVTVFPSVETALKNNNLNKKQSEQLENCVNKIKETYSMVKALGIKSSLFEKIQDLITKINVLGDEISGFAYYRSPSDPQYADYTQKLESYCKKILDEGIVLRKNTQNLFGELQTEFNKKKYLIF